MLTTTTNKLLNADPVSYGWSKLTGKPKEDGSNLGTDEPLAFSDILRHYSVEDCYWALRTAYDESTKKNFMGLCVRMIDFHKQIEAASMLKYDSYRIIVTKIRSLLGDTNLGEYAYSMFIAIDKNTKNQNREYVTKSLRTLLTEFISEDFTC